LLIGMTLWSEQFAGSEPAAAADKAAYTDLHGSLLPPGACDLTGGFQRGERQRLTLGPKELETLWADLAGADAARAYRAICTLAAAPQQTISFLGKRLRPLEPADARLVARLIADLDNDDFGIRERASAGLEKLGWAAAPALRKATDGARSLEVRRRVEALLDELHGLDFSPEQLRELRAVDVLERIGTPEARMVVETLTRGVPEAPLTWEAKATLQRLGGRAAALP
jgi:hypothetical protein